VQILSPSNVEVDTRNNQILRVLTDKNCLAILSTTKENAMTASMIYSCCNISPSTAYRKLKLLQELNLLRVTYTIQPNSAKSKLFQSKVTRVNILLCKKQLQINADLVPLE
jgi:Fe2+ or Zn2+ uptake regulation protein